MPGNFWEMGDLCLVFFPVSARATTRRAQDSPNDSQDCPNAPGLVRTKLGTREGTAGRFHVCVIARPQSCLGQPLTLEL
jgi:hypothetical protein